jgi:hypothetical protein
MGIARDPVPGAVCAYHACPRSGRHSLGRAAARWVVVSIFGFPVGVTGPEQGLELTRPVMFCSWECTALWAAEAGDLR